MPVIIRPARKPDLIHIHNIYTHYVLETSLTFVTKPPPFSFTVDKYEDIVEDRSLPFLVAVDEEDDKDVWGYTSLSPFRSASAGYASTVELTLFLHPEKVGQGVGSRLLEEILGTVRREEVWHMWKEFEEVPEGEELKRVRNVIAITAVDVERREEGDWLRKWYVGKGFEERGRMKGVGFKKGRWIDTIYLQYQVP